MKIEILDIERLIDVNKLQEVTSPSIFSSKMVFDPDGLLSNEIFGISRDDRRSTFAYIDLRRPYLHPHIYKKVLKQGVFRDIIYVVSGQHRYVIRNGLPVRDDENGWTGLDQLYKHWDEIDWSKKLGSSAKVTIATDSEDAPDTVEEAVGISKINRDLLSKLKKNQVFITKQLVCPPAYRDVMLTGTIDTSDHVNKLNTMYSQLIRMVATLSEGGIFSATRYATQAKVQDQLVMIMDYFGGLIKGKTGLMRRNLMGKKIDYGVRSVISAPAYNSPDIKDQMVDFDHCAVPISECCSLFYPFIQSWVINFFTREIINDPAHIAFYDPETKQPVTGMIIDPELQFSEKNIRKMINDYIRNPDNRFRVINVAVEDPINKKARNASLILKGKEFLDNTTSRDINRAMTVTDLLYLACVDTCERKQRHVMTSRYPVGTDKGIFLNRIRVQSTAKHTNVIFNGIEYPNYPVIDFNVDHDNVGVQFIDTFVYSNSHLAGMDADYDGDQVSVRGIWSDEANEEAEQIMQTKMSALDITGMNSKVVAKEVFNALYELTKDGSDPKQVPAADVEKYLAMKPDDITLITLTDMFADTVNTSEKNVSGKRKARHQTWDKMTVPAGYFYTGQPAIQTTIGRFILNKFILESIGAIRHCTFMNDVLNGNAIRGLDNFIANIYMRDLITRDQFNRYLDRRDALGYWLSGMLSHTISERMLKPLPEVEKRRAELCEKYKDELAAGNIDIMTKISDELVAYARTLLKDDPGMDLYLSGDLDFNNNYKNNAIIKGAVKNKLTDQFDFVATSLMGGIDVKDIPAHANGILAAQYPASISTEESGYTGKKILALLQMMDLDEHGSDCGTKNLIPITITPRNKDQVVYTYIDNGAGQLILLTPDNIGKYVGKQVMMRTPMTCINDKICSKCAGELFYMLGVEHAGLFATQISHALLNLGLKAKHDSNVNLFTFDPNSLIVDI